MSRRLWIVCLMLALLPLRGWAAASMTVPAVVTHAVAAQVAEADAPAAAAMPSCHEAGGDETGSAGHACNLCDLCHSAAADLAEVTLPAMPLPAVKPLPAVARDTGRHAVGGLDRPPRSFLA